MNGLSYVLYEADASGNIEAEYVRGCQLHTMTRDSETYVYLSDAHMDVRALADSEGNLVNRYRYDAWGNTIYAEEEVENPYRYCQEEYDAESGNTYLRARYYSATSANFLSADAYAGSIDNPMTLNKYAYAGANPVMYADPSGYMFTMAECLTSINMQTMLRSSFAGAVIGGISNGLYCAGDTMSAGGDWDQIIRSFFEGFGTGSVTGMFMGALGSVFMAWKYFKIATGALAIFGFYRGVDSAGEALEEGNEYQALYRLGTSVFSITNWYRMFGKDTARAIEQALRQAQQKAGVVATGVVTAIRARSGQVSWGRSSSVDDIVDIMKSGEMTSDGRNIITQLDNNTKVIFRMDVGENAHSMDMYGYNNPVNHINIEIQVKASSGKYKPKWNFHMILDDFGKVSDSFATGIWTKK